MDSKGKKIILAVIFQAAIIFAIILFKLSVLGSGTTVLLKIDPVDPRDPLRGDYVTFRYEISHYIGSAQKSDIKEGDKVYVTLYKSGAYWRIKQLSKNKPDDGKIFIKGRVSSLSPEPITMFRGVGYSIVYGIEEYFIPEGVGQDFRFGGRDTAARVAIDEDGNAVIKEILVDGEPWP